ncbi:MAG: hypothetical protein KA105_04650 [Caulobacter sp.]|nr:hypothetical protein [Caulobacter sp.]
MSAAARQEVFRGRTVGLMIVVGVLAFAALTVLSVYAPNLRKGDDGGPHALSKSAIGYAGAAAYFKARGDNVLISRGRLPVGAADGLLVLTPQLGHRRDTTDAVHFDGVRLVVLPKWHAGPDPRHPGWVRQGRIIPAEMVGSSVLKGYPKGIELERRAGRSRPTLNLGDGVARRIGDIESFQTLKGPNLQAVVTDERGGILLARVAWPEAKPSDDSDDVDEDEALPPETYLLADPDLLNTQGLKSLATARATDVMIHNLSDGGPLIFDATIHGFERSRSFLSLVFEPPFLGGTLCAVAAALLAGIGAAVRFGPVRVAPPPYAMGKTALVDTTAGLIRMARREHRMAEGYARLCRDLAARAVGAPRQLEAEQLEAFLDRLGTQRGTVARFSDLIKAAREARNLTDLKTTARGLYDWRLEMTRENR